MASSVIQQSVVNAANSLTGLAVQDPLEMPGQLFQSAGLPVDARGSEKLRAKIWSNEYIDFDSLVQFLGLIGFVFLNFFIIFFFSLVQWEVATRLGTREYRHPGILSHCSMSGPVGRGYV